MTSSDVRGARSKIGFVTKPRFVEGAAVLAMIAVWAAAAPAQQPARGEIAVFVVDQATGRPVEGAEVIMNAWPNEPWILGSPPTTDEIMRIVAASTVRSRTGRDGRTHIPRGAGEIALLAQTADGRSAHEWVGPAREGTVTLAVEAEETMQVAVVDADGKPAGNVNVQAVIPRGLGWRTPWSGITDEKTGIAVVRHWERVRKVAASEARPGARAAEVLVTAALPLRDPAVARLDPSGKRPERITITLPATASLAVSLVDEDDRPVLTRVNVTVTSSVSSSVAEAGSLPRHATVLTTTGGAHFPRCGVEAALEVGADSPDGAFPRVTETVVIPAGAIDHACTVRLETKTPAVIGRIVDAAGRPIARTVLAVDRHLESSRSRSFGQPVVTNDEGAFRHPIHYPIADGEKWLLRIDVPGTTPPCTATAPVPPTLRDGVYDVGVVRVAATPLAVAGTVNDTAGRPVAGAMVRIERQSLDASGWNESWAVQGGAWEITDAAGRFEVRGELGEGLWAVRVDRRGYAGARRIPFTPGSQDVLATLTRSATVRGRLETPAGPRVRLLARGSAASGRPHLANQNADTDGAGWTVPAADGAFAWSGLRPGTLDVAISINGIEEPSLLVSGIAIEEGSDLAPEPLNPISLAGRLHRVEVTVLGPESRPIEDAQVVYPSVGGVDTRVRERTDASGVATLVLPNPEPRIGVFKPGYRPRKLRREDAKLPPGAKLTGDAKVTVVLEPGIPFTAALAEAVTIAPRFDLRASLKASGVPPALAWVEQEQRPQVTLGPGGTVELRAEWPGFYELLIVACDLENPVMGRRRVHPDWVAIEVLDGRADQRFTLAVTQEGVDAAIRELTERPKAESAPSSR